MSELIDQRNAEAASVLQETFTSLRYLTDERGSRTDVVLSLDSWKQLIDWLETVDDRLALEGWLPALRQGPQQAGALRWSEIEDEWLSEDV
jgi:hypothetical protein